MWQEEVRRLQTQLENKKWHQDKFCHLKTGKRKGLLQAMPSFEKIMGGLHMLGSMQYPPVWIPCLMEGEACCIRVTRNRCCLGVFMWWQSMFCLTLPPRIATMNNDSVFWPCRVFVLGARGNSYAPGIYVSIVCLGLVTCWFCSFCWNKMRKEKGYDLSITLFYSSEMSKTNVWLIPNAHWTHWEHNYCPDTKTLQNQMTPSLFILAILGGRLKQNIDCHHLNTPRQQQFLVALPWQTAPAVRQGIPHEWLLHCPSSIAIHP